jgi:hypothetical protein
VLVEEVKVPAWLHRHIIGRKGANIKRTTQDFPKVHTLPYALEIIEALLN